MRTRIWQVVAVAAGLALVGAACGDDDDDDAADTATTEAAADAGATTAGEDPATDETSMATSEAGGGSETGEAGEAGTIPEVAAAAGDFTTLLAAAEAAGLVETLSGEGPLTVFAPTDAAFADALEALGVTAEELLADTATLTSVLTYHVVPGEYLAEDVLAAATLPTANGAELTVDATAGTVSGETTATIVMPDVTASNGVIHVIDAVLLPPA
jgi:uncharacterized surface protein with fasciclin (FAS1) repeats